MLEGLIGFILGTVVGAGAAWFLLRKSTEIAPREPLGKPAAAPPAPLSIPAGGSLLDAMLGESDAGQNKAEEEESSEKLIASLRQNLRLKYMYDDVKINRALDLERQRDPQASELDLLKAAIYRWERENG